ncbi:S-adenosyl-l-methionine hydroxide adenosyltransferase family protein [Chitinophaga pendula]|uniref:SAM hydrolase/SAM-dependent halogenase family protein n=1 Tax=Chitinophaga TaxID=79328 RepID=UPI000BB071FD|nr:MULTISPECIES: S-adenosyl-l-methionine hydroxide adenosyltransferase family protein [Chitinophaga]ASZ13396.1 DNA-directed RNA polymerase subunit delta [Chitinophaga sp. MD30]UCJ08980.1 S-adenosyl-l-methionine hydroxide adenosyltransferase family protein [Chitinophaga pendula]
MNIHKYVLLLVSLCATLTVRSQQKVVVFQTDFGLKDGAVAAMKGVAFGISSSLSLFDLTHEIPAYNIWEAAYRLEQTAPYWPAGTVFVSVVDPGVGSERKSVVLKTKTGHYFVTPDNGTLTLVARSMGIQELREIDESRNRRQQSAGSYTFHGRDVYAYTAARLAAGVITFEQVGQRMTDTVVSIPFQAPHATKDHIKGNIPILDIQYGNVWTNIDEKTFNSLQCKHGDMLRIRISKGSKLVWQGTVPFVSTFATVPEGKDLAYLNSLMNLSLAINMGNFSEKYRVFSGPEWNVEVSRNK